MKWKCMHCSETFTEPEYIEEYVDDSNRVAFVTPICPYCGSEDLEETYGEDDEE